MADQKPPATPWKSTEAPIEEWQPWRHERDEPPVHGSSSAINSRFPFTSAFDRNTIPRTTYVDPRRTASYPIRSTPRYLPSSSYTTATESSVQAPRTALPPLGPTFQAPTYPSYTTARPYGIFTDSSQSEDSDSDASDDLSMISQYTTSRPTAQKSQDCYQLAEGKDSEEVNRHTRDARSPLRYKPLRGVHVDDSESSDDEDNTDERDDDDDDDDDDEDDTPTPSCGTSTPRHGFCEPKFSGAGVTSPIDADDDGAIANIVEGVGCLAIRALDKMSNQVFHERYSAMVEKRKSISDINDWALELFRNSIQHGYTAAQLVDYLKLSGANPDFARSLVHAARTNSLQSPRNHRLPRPGGKSPSRGSMLTQTCSLGTGGEVRAGGSHKRSSAFSSLVSGTMVHRGTPTAPDGQQLTTSGQESAPAFSSSPSSDGTSHGGIPRNSRSKGTKRQRMKDEDDGMSSDDDEDRSSSPSEGSGKRPRSEVTKKQLPCFVVGCDGADPTPSELLRNAAKHHNFFFCHKCCRKFSTQAEQEAHKVNGRCDDSCVAMFCPGSAAGQTFDEQDQKARMRETHVLSFNKIAQTGRPGNAADLEETSTFCCPPKLQRHKRTLLCPTWNQTVQSWRVADVWQYLYILQNADTQSPLPIIRAGYNHSHVRPRSRRPNFTSMQTTAPKCPSGWASSDAIPGRVSKRTSKGRHSCDKSGHQCFEEQKESLLKVIQHVLQLLDKKDPNNIFDQHLQHLLEQTPDTKKLLEYYNSYYQHIQQNVSFKETPRNFPGNQATALMEAKAKAAEILEDLKAIKHMESESYRMQQAIPGHEQATRDSVKDLMQYETSVLREAGIEQVLKQLYMPKNGPQSFKESIALIRSKLDGSFGLQEHGHRQTVSLSAPGPSTTYHLDNTNALSGWPTNFHAAFSLPGLLNTDNFQTNIDSSQYAQEQTAMSADIFNCLEPIPTP